MEKKLIDSIHWLSEATKPDTRNSKYVKISLALETLLGGEPKEDENLKVRSITIMLAERAAFIAGESTTDRLNIDRDIHKYYGKRSTIIHGDEIDITLEEIDEFGELVRKLTLAMLRKLAEIGYEIKNTVEFEKWVKKQKYTLPNDQVQEVLHAHSSHRRDWRNGAL
jgi:hypothetical protein